MRTLEGPRADEVTGARGWKGAAAPQALISGRGARIAQPGARIGLSIALLERVLVGNRTRSLAPEVLGACGLAGSDHQPPPPRLLVGVGCWLAEPPSPPLRADVVGELGGLLVSEQAANSEAATNPDRDKSRRERLSRFMLDLTDRETRP
jgi:hypothetical protein